MGKVDPETGRYNGQYMPIALCGRVRANGEADVAINELTKDL